MKYQERKILKSIKSLSEKVELYFISVEYSSGFFDFTEKGSGHFLDDAEHLGDFDTKWEAVAFLLKHNKVTLRDNLIFEAE